MKLWLNETIQFLIAILFWVYNINILQLFSDGNSIKTAIIGPKVRETKQNINTFNTYKNCIHVYESDRNRTWVRIAAQTLAQTENDSDSAQDWALSRVGFGLRWMAIDWAHEVRLNAHSVRINKQVMTRMNTQFVWLEPWKSIDSWYESQMRDKLLQMNKTEIEFNILMDKFRRLCFDMNFNALPSSDRYSQRFI